MALEGVPACISAVSTWFIPDTPVSLLALGFPDEVTPLLLGCRDHEWKPAAVKATGLPGRLDGHHAALLGGRACCPPHLHRDRRGSGPAGQRVRAGGGTGPVHPIQLPGLPPQEQLSLARRCLPNPLIIGGREVGTSGIA